MTRTIYFPENLKHLRTKAGLRQSDLAEKLFIHEHSIYYYERERHCPGIHILAGIADYFNVSLDDLMFKNLEGE